MEPIGVVINGALGKMGQEITKALVREPGLKVVGAVEKEVTQQYLPLPKISELVPFSSDLGSLLKRCNPDVVVDFTNAEACLAAARIATKQKVNLVIGTTGLSEEDLAEIEQLCQANEVGAVVAPNFSLAASLLIHLARFAAKFFDHAEIMEMHHDKKIDAPSGTAIATARAMSQTHGKHFIHTKAEREIINNTRGGQMYGIAIHSLRLPGFMAGQEVIFSEAGETLSLRHEAISRECYMSGIILAIKEVAKHKGLVYGLESLVKL
ncbi:MAG: 4-hydroxy-tetrahydrodipicolinate reductase [Dehalococcoidia bacterium]|nr:4-hydroxy-tetrahydrodipicolinate reductase [Dehalococcoidia bacterium]